MRQEAHDQLRSGLRPDASGPARRTARHPRWTHRLTWTRILHTLTSLPLAIVYFVLTVLTVALSLVLSVTVVGVLFFAPTFALLRALTRFERYRARHLLGLPVSAPARRVPSASGVLRRTWARLKDRQSWRDAVFLLLTLPLAAVALLVTGLMVVLFLRAVVYPFMAVGNPDFYQQAWGGPTIFGAVAVHTTPGILTVLFGPRIIRTVTHGYGLLVMRMVSGPKRS